MKKGGWSDWGSARVGPFCEPGPGKPVSRAGVGLRSEHTRARLLEDALGLPAEGATGGPPPRRSAGGRGFLLLVMLLFVLGSLAVGVLISTLARTQVQAVFGTYAYAFPTIFLSGFVFPVDGIPPFFQLLLVPARYLIEGLRGVMLKGVGWAVLWPHLLALPCFSTLVLFLASVRFQRQGGRL